MKLADAALLGALGVLAWSQWQEWRLNRDDAIDIPYHGVPTASLWQCGQLIKEMAALAEQGAKRVRIQGRGIGRDGSHLHKTWQRRVVHG
jgi:hypothetical protein